MKTVAPALLVGGGFLPARSSVAVMNYFDELLEMTDWLARLDRVLPYESRRAFLVAVLKCGRLVVEHPFTWIVESPDIDDRVELIRAVKLKAGKTCQVEFVSRRKQVPVDQPGCDDRIGVRLLVRCDTHD